MGHSHNSEADGVTLLLHSPERPEDRRVGGQPETGHGGALKAQALRNHPQRVGTRSLWRLF